MSVRNVLLSAALVAVPALAWGPDARSPCHGHYNRRRRGSTRPGRPPEGGQRD